MNPEVMTKVCKCVAEVLALSPSEVSPSSRLTEQLGADSLDLVELMFQLEQEFSITLENRDLSLTSQLGIPESEIHKDEVLTPKALELLRARFPEAKDILRDGARRKQLASLLTVEEVARSIERRLASPVASAAR